jgi:hypothetical protein
MCTAVEGLLALRSVQRVYNKGQVIFLSLGWGVSNETVRSEELGPERDCSREAQKQLYE